MKFLPQLWLLLWKNYTLRKRQKLRMVAELLWPLFLFLILAWVRSRGLKYRMHACHFEPKPMPSAGTMQFIRGFFCTFNNTCHERVPLESQFAYNETLVSRLVDDVVTVLSMQVNETVATSVRRVGGDVAALTRFATLLQADQANVNGSVSLGDVIANTTAYYALLKDFGIGRSKWSRSQGLNASIELSNVRELVERIGLLMTFSELDDLLCSSEYFGDLVESAAPATTAALVREVCSLPALKQQEFVTRLVGLIDQRRLLELISRISEQSMQYRLMPEDWLSVLRLWREVVTEIQKLNSFRQLLEDVNELANRFSGLWNDEGAEQLANNTLNITGPILSTIRVQAVLCGYDAEALVSPIPKHESRAPVNRIRERLREVPDTNFAYDKTISAQCNQAFFILETNLVTKLMWRTVKPYVRGKILYTPTSPATDKLMKRVIASFRPIQQLLDFVKEWPRRSRYYRKYVITLQRRLRIIGKVLRPVLDLVNNKWPLPAAVVNATGLGNITNPTQADLMKKLSRMLKPRMHSYWAHLFQRSDDVADFVATYLDCFEFDKLEGMPDEEALIRKSVNLTADNKLWAGLVFMDMDKDTQELPTLVRYKIRIDGDRIDSTKHIMDRLTTLGPRRRPYIDLKYITYGFAYLQDMVEHSIIEEQTGTEVKTGVYLHQMPYPCYIRDEFVLAISRTFPMFMVLAWVYTSAMIIKSIVYEKEQRLKEVMRILGLSNSVHWVGWFLTSFISMAVSVVLLTIVLIYGDVLEYSDPSVVLLFLLCFSLATISFSFFLSTLFSKANMAAAAGGIIYFISYLPYPFLVTWYDYLDYFHKLLGALLSNIAFGFGCLYFAHFEERGTGIQWDNIDQSPVLDDDFSLLQCMMVLLLDSVLYALLTWYIEAVFPGQYGIPRPFYFPFLKEYWLGAQQVAGSKETESMLLDSVGDDKFEAEPTNLPLGVSVDHLRKVYANGKVAVDDLTINFYEGQITSFLGHNGAGKTTTISILIGLFPPTKGTARIYNYDIRTDMDQIRQSLGICPQHNTLFHEMTVAEHIWFYARLKGRSGREVEEESDKMVEDLGLPHKRDELSKNLSGGMQRKLSIAVAFVGGSRTVILDEPTSGVDPYSRRSIWELLMKYKQGRTIILTTHFMDEADILGDRIAIISQGALQCCGSSLFLKGNFGLGYYLTLARFQESQLTLRISSDTEVPDPPAEPLGDSTKSAETVSTVYDRRISKQDEDKITKFIQDYVRRAYLLENFGTEMTYVLPNEPHLAERMEGLLDDLDENLEKLGITSYGLSDTSLEEIFLRLADDGSQLTERVISQQISSITDGGKYPTRLRATDLRRHSLSLMNSPATSTEQVNASRQATGSLGGDVSSRLTDASGTDDEETPPPEPSPLRKRRSSMKPRAEAANYKRRKMPLWTRHIHALHVKRFHHCRRNFRGLFCEIILPAFFVCLSMIFTVILPPLAEEPPLELSPWTYQSPFYVFFSNDHVQSYRANLYEEELIGFPGLGTKCVKENLTCGNPPARAQFYTSTIGPVKTKPCSCETGSMSCPAGAKGPTPAQAPGAAGEYVLNVTDRNVSDWLVKTRSDYFKKRWGGFTFGYNNPLAKVNYSLYREGADRIANALYRNGVSPNWTADVPLNWTRDKLANLEKYARTSATLDNVKVWFNNKGWASSVAYMNAFNNILLRSRLNASVKSVYGIEVTNHPLNFTQRQLQREVTKHWGISLLHAICVIFALSFVPASFTLFLIEERQCKAKHLQFVSGVRPVIYWTAEYMWDMVNYLVPAALCVIIFVAFGERAYVSESNLPGLLSLLMLYGWASIPLMYPFSFLFTVPASAFVTLACGNLFIGIVTTIATFVLEILNDAQLQMIADILKRVFLIFPHYCLGRGLMDMAANQLKADALASFGLSAGDDNIFRFDFLGRNLLCMFIQGILAFLFTLLVEYRPCCRRRHILPKALTATYSEEDVDVARERQRVLSGRADKDMLRAFNLTKVYKKGRLPAVNHLCLGVRKGECFGLLGVNGAGKTSTFRMLTGDTSISYGDAFVVGHSVIDEPQLCRQSLGYCPQFDALDSLLTGREHIEFYARLRDVPAADVARVVDSNIRRLGLTPYADKTAGRYSGGNKRKLSTALALIGDPPLVFLDEPTSGMDPKARRLLWSCVTDIVRDGRSVVLTSHSMEECEALCTRLAIMVNGQFKCLGSLQHLKSRFGDGYTVTLRSRLGQLSAVEDRLVSQLPQGELREKHHAQLSYQLPSVDLQLSSVFRLLESMRTEQLVEDYSINQTTLDEVFVRFACEQTEMLEDEVVGSRNSLNDRSMRRFFGPKKVRFPARMEEAETEGATDAEIQPLNGTAEVAVVSPAQVSFTDTTNV